VSAEKLIDLWGSKVEGRNKKLAEHPIQIKLLLETYLQARHFCNYAMEKDKNDIARAYAVIFNKITEIMNIEKQELLDKHFDEVSEDIVFEAIRDYCSDVEL
jgi:dihydroneopterin aldolase